MEVAVWHLPDDMVTGTLVTIFFRNPWSCIVEIHNIYHRNPRLAIIIAHVIPTLVNHEGIETIAIGIQQFFTVGSKFPIHLSQLAFQISLGYTNYCEEINYFHTDHITDYNREVSTKPRD